jgi:hypothetical protein
MEVALGRGRTQRPGTGRQRGGGIMDTGFLPLRPGGLWHLVMPGGSTMAGDREEVPLEAPASL